MNKRGLIKFIFILLATIISSYFIITNNNDSILMILLDFLFALTTFMFCNKNKIDKFKFIYDVILLLLMIFTAGFFVYFTYSLITCYFDVHCSMEYETISLLLYPMFLFMMLLFSLKDISNKTNKVNDTLTIIVSIIIILAHARYYLDPNFFNKSIDKFITNVDLYHEYSYYYIVRNYIYFIIMYFIILIHRKVNKI